MSRFFLYLCFPGHSLPFLFKNGESLYDAIDDLFRSGRASRDIDINRDNLIDATDDVVALPEYTAGCSAGADCDDHFWFWHLFIEVLDHRAVLFVDPTGDQQDICMLWVSGVD